MTETDDVKMPLTSADVTDERLQQLKTLFPEAFDEGNLDVEKLKTALGNIADEGRERYGLTWAGKADAVRAVQTLSVGALVPASDESVNFDTTENVFIEGDNLEVLKLLQKSYHGAVKMIYIDPPYNTGNEFIYPDNFREGLQEYLRYSGQTGEEGHSISTNTETSGRYHSKWLSMMYPRLFLARNLLCEEGVIFVSIDDHEVHNLRHLMDEIFGPENFIANIIWQKVYAPKNTAKFFSEDHDHIVVYCRNAEHWRPILLPRTDEANARYSNPDNDPRGPWKSSDLTARNYYSQGKYEVTGPTGKKFSPSKGNYWRHTHDKFLALDKDNRIWWGPNSDCMPAMKRFISEVQQGIVPQTLWKYEDVGHTQEAKKELVKYIPFNETENVLNSVKPVRLLQRILQITTDSDSHDTVLDFFSGSAPTAHAVIKQNMMDNGNRRFICVQIPEPLSIPEPELKTIFDLGTSRLKSVIKEFLESGENTLPIAEIDVDQMDLGFKVFKLTSSNFKIWNPAGSESNEEALEKQLKLYADNILPDRNQQDILYELILKSGLPLTAKIEAATVEDSSVYVIADGLLAISLEDELTQELLRGIMELKPKRVICLDRSFKGNDQLKTNIVLEMKSHDIEFRTV